MQPDFERRFRPAGGSGFARGGECFAQVWHEGGLVGGSDGRGDGYGRGL